MQCGWSETRYSPVPSGTVTERYNSLTTTKNHDQLIFMEHFLCVKHCIHVISFDLHHSSLRQVFLLFPFFQKKKLRQREFK